MKRTHSNIQDNVQLSQETDGHIQITIKNPFSNLNSLSTKDLLKLLADKDDPRVLSCENKTNILEKLHSVDIRCENCENPLSLETKLKLEKRLSDDTEDLEFKETVLSRLERIETMLANIVEKLQEKPPEKRQKLASTSLNCQEPEKSVPETSEMPEFIEYLEEEHLEDPIIQEKFITLKEDEKPDNVSQHFPINNVQEMEAFNERLLAEEDFVEEVLNWMKQQNFKISAKIGETSKILQK